MAFRSYRGKKAVFAVEVSDKFCFWGELAERGLLHSVTIYPKLRIVKFCNKFFFFADKRFWLSCV